MSTWTRQRRTGEFSLPNQKKNRKTETFRVYTEKETPRRTRVDVDRDPSHSHASVARITDTPLSFPFCGRKLNDLLDALDFNQVVIFVRSVARCQALDKLLRDCSFPSICIHGRLNQEERLNRYKAFKEGQKRIMVATDLIHRGIDIERVNIVINYDMPQDSEESQGADTYLHRVGRAGRFGTKGLAITFVASEADSTVLNSVQERFDVDIKELPDQIDSSSYMS